MYARPENPGVNHTGSSWPVLCEYVWMGLRSSSASQKYAQSACLPLQLFEPSLNLGRIQRLNGTERISKDFTSVLRRYS